jgi:AcrR family transcriptional regulator
MPRPPARRDATPPAGTDLRDRILAATTDLLRERRFDALSVADIIAAAGVSRASFYFYFAGKQAVLAALVRQAIARGHEAATPWTSAGTSAAPDPVAAIRSGVTDGARLWRDNAGVLMAIVESWGADPALRELWLAQMDTFTEATVARIAADPAVVERLAGLDLRAVAASLTWLGERLYYLAAARVPPFDDETVLIDTLTNTWTATLYGKDA